VKLVFDENLSPRLARVLSEEFPGSTHVSLAGLRGAEDGRIWDHARNEHFAIVSKDTDFRERSYLEGAPPKIVWLDVGNAGAMAIEEPLRNERERLERFAVSDESSILILSLRSKAV
jgi:predicted nuclease of predicted toxin-antitoxin system